MAQLVELLEKVNDSSVKDNAFEIFKEIATELMSKFAIKKGDDYYQMVEIEFYWYSPNHRDTSTYPRDTKPGNWFLHSSGVDITLKSKNIDNIDELRDTWEKGKRKKWVNFNCEGCYGGILIRTLRKFKHEDKENKVLYKKEEKQNYISGPWKCCDMLFDYLPCNGKSEDVSRMLPEIIPINKDDMMPNVGSKFIGQAKRNGITNKHTKGYADSPYCFYINQDYLTGWKNSSFPNKPWNSRKV